MSLILSTLILIMVVYVAKYTRIRITDNEPGVVDFVKVILDKLN
jgi:hypothetical protein